MVVSQKCKYALRAVFELALRSGARPVRIGEIAEVQAIPPKFLELILVELKRGGFVESRRGARGGYLLRVAPAELTAGDIIEFVDGPVMEAGCPAEPGQADGSLHSGCVFEDLWSRASQAMAEVYAAANFQDMVEKHRAKTNTANYYI